MTKKQDNCTHHYIIESPNGALANGICKYCKHEKTHYNSRDGWSLQQRKSISLNKESALNYFNPNQNHSN